MENSSAQKITPNYARIGTAIFIVIAVLGAIALGNKSMAVLFMLINVLGARELCYVLEDKQTAIQNVVYMTLGILPFGVMYLFDLDFDQVYFYLLIFSVAVMLGLIINLWTSNIKFSKIKYPFMLSYWALPFSLAAYFFLFGGQDAKLMVFSIITLIWTSDTMAYFTGKAIGKNKLFPSVSPGKTIEGSLGAGAFSILVGLGFAFAYDQSYLLWTAIAIGVWILGTLGDLVESKLKRVQNVKDSGSILPGHGGFLDRFDSLVLLIPFLLLLEYYIRT